VNGKDKETDVDIVVKSQAMHFFVIPAKAGGSEDSDPVFSGSCNSLTHTV
jgi:hypothetical protein